MTRTPQRYPQFAHNGNHYFTVEAQERMLREFSEFDRNMIHQKYWDLVEELGEMTDLSRNRQGDRRLPRLSGAIAISEIFDS